MNHSSVPWNHTDACRDGRHVLRLFVVLIYCTLNARAQSTRQRARPSAPSSIRATHLLGSENAKGNCTGTLCIHDDSLQFQQNGKAGVQVEVGAILGIFLGEEDKQDLFDDVSGFLPVEVEVSTGHDN